MGSPSKKKWNCTFVPQRQTSSTMTDKAPIVIDLLDAPSETPPSDGDWYFVGPISFQNSLAKGRAASAAPSEQRKNTEISCSHDVAWGPDFTAEDLEKLYTRRELAECLAKNNFRGRSKLRNIHETAKCVITLRDRNALRHKPRGGRIRKLTKYRNTAAVQINNSYVVINNNNNNNKNNNDNHNATSRITLENGIHVPYSFYTLPPPKRNAGDQITPSENIKGHKSLLVDMDTDTTTVTTTSATLGSPFGFVDLDSGIINRVDNEKCPLLQVELRGRANVVKVNCGHCYTKEGLKAYVKANKRKKKIVCALNGCNEEISITNKTTTTTTT